MDFLDAFVEGRVPAERVSTEMKLRIAKEALEFLSKHTKQLSPISLLVEEAHSGPVDLANVSANEGIDQQTPALRLGKSSVEKEQDSQSKHLNLPPDRTYTVFMVSPNATVFKLTYELGPEETSEGIEETYTFRRMRSGRLEIVPEQEAQEILVRHLDKVIEGVYRVIQGAQHKLSLEWDELQDKLDHLKRYGDRLDFTKKE